MTLLTPGMAIFKPTESSNALQKKISEGRDKQVENRKLQNEMPILLIQQNKDEFVKSTATVTEGVKPVAEQAKVATASVNKPLFDFQDPINKNQGQNISSIFAGLATSSALVASEQGSSAGDKKEGKNAFISAQKTLDDLRREKMEANNSKNIFCVVC